MQSVGGIDVPWPEAPEETDDTLGGVDINDFY